MAPWAMLRRLRDLQAEKPASDIDPGKSRVFIGLVNLASLTK